ncbi:hypothetical protein EIP91_007043 [Steccherinum ochraceum]|uniref:RING-type domain-containing protein n=1 Tax=Steccherinum ochraceum TaxID=92696 RepID=A0A4R0RAJ8_9APHY|nr:hypothetical protein EIP91_007043 [Steccherinum ochraceum]
MGQSNSRSSRPSSSSPTSPRRPDPAPAASSSSRSNGQATPTASSSESPSASEKKSRRRSMLSLISRSSSSASSSDHKDNDESPLRTATSLRKRWRSSRRFSKAHSPLDAVKEPSKESSISETTHDYAHTDVAPVQPVETQITAGPSHSTRPSTPFPTSRPTTPSVEAPPETQNEQLSSGERQLSENIGNWLSGSPQSTSSNLYEPEPNIARSDIPNGADIEREINEFLQSAPSDDGDTVAPANISDAGSNTLPRPSESVPQTQLPPRHFPPPGTLVVVQGVVNTTDSPSGAASTQRPANTSAPPPPPPESLLAPPPQRRSSSAPRSLRSGNPSEGGRRTGFSSFMPRPSSMISRRPSTSSRTSLAQGSNRANESPALSDPISVESTPSSESARESESGDSDAATPTDSEGGSHTLSPGSIDVLGTLLSVAAAATAASLFSPGFSNPPANPGVPIAPSAGRPMSPTPTAGLGGFGGLNRLAELGLDPPGNGPRPSQSQPDQFQGDRDARDRIRSVWENFRDRLGLGHRGSGPHAGSGSANSSDAAEQESNDRPGPSPTPIQANETEERARPLSPDPGFEAFLTSLQADLRTVLSANHSPLASEDSDEPSPGGLRAEPVIHEGPQHEADVPADVLPFADDIDSDLESVTDDAIPSPTSTERPRHYARTPTPIPPAATLPHIAPPDNEDENPITGDRRQPAINLWRVYRFPPIPTPPGHALRMGAMPPTEGPQPQGLAASSAPPPLVPPAVPSVPARSSVDSSPDLSFLQAEQPLPSTSANPADSNVVVPVIVVGLQSVDTAPDRADFEDGPLMPHDDLHRHDDPYDTEDFGVPPHDIATGGRPATPRGRTWQSRAANALRGLRPGRRNGSRGRRANEAAGSRTFLIYVIGGYYPPNHHVVTGSDSLDSYEALWELADLLGQVKPPVATREDIEKSGLEIVKAFEMKEHESFGRIASNCMDRCLICLDDYEPDNDVRVMSCRHAFHKECVDKWLQVGRNNCPACRSKGVSTSSESPPLPSPSYPIA